MAQRTVVITTDSKHNHLVAPKLFGRNYATAAPDQVWVTDSLSQSREKWCYLTIYKDLFTRCVPYASVDFKKVLQKHGLMQSKSRKENCWDNAVAEAFFHSLKTQLIHHCKFLDMAEAERTLFNYIEVYYNRQKKHSTNGRMTRAGL